MRPTFPAACRTTSRRPAVGSRSPGTATPSRSCRSTSRIIFSQLGPQTLAGMGRIDARPHAYAQNHGQYVPRHAPAIYYTSIRRSICRRDMLPLPKGLPASRRGSSRGWRPTSSTTCMTAASGRPRRGSTPTSPGRQGLLRTAGYRSGHTAIFVWFDTGDGGCIDSHPHPADRGLAAHAAPTLHQADHQLSAAANLGEHLPPALHQPGMWRSQPRGLVPPLRLTACSRLLSFTNHSYSSGRLIVWNGVSGAGILRERTECKRRTGRTRALASPRTAARRGYRDSQSRKGADRSRLGPAASPVARRPAGGEHPGAGGAAGAGPGS